MATRSDGAVSRASCPGKRTMALATTPHDVVRLVKLVARRSRMASGTLVKHWLPMLVTLPGTDRKVRLVQSRKKEPPSAPNCGDRVTARSAVQPWNAELPMVSMLEISAVTRPVQFLKKLLPRVVTLSGSLTSVSPAHP